MITEFKFPDVGSGITEGEILRVHVKEGDKVKEDQVLFEIETAKAIVDMPSPAEGIVLKVNVKETQTIKVGDILAIIGEKGEKVNMKKDEPEKIQISKSVKKQVAISDVSATSGRIVATPHTRQFAKELGIDITKVIGTGHGGRITDEDIQNFTVGTGKGIANQTQPKTESPRIKFEKYGEVLRIEIHGVRKTIMERIQISTSVPTVTHTDEADITSLVKLREKEKKIAENKGIKLTYLPFIAKAVIIALKEHPYVNSSIEEESRHIVLKKYYNIGIAVDTADGLIVPIIK
ncbi:MAG: dihydrolipoamide acetyltransferase family protein, partial [Nanoarchaeota archaeon]